MTKTITSEVLVAYSQCPRKAFLLLYSDEKGVPHEYISILDQQKRINQNQYINRLKQEGRDIQPYLADYLKNKANFVSNAILQVAGLESECGLLTKVQGHSLLGNYHYEPTLFVETHKIIGEQKLELAFVGYVLGRLQRKPPVVGTVVGADGSSHRVELGNSDKLIHSLLEPLQKWANVPSLEPPAIILNKHCATCPFRGSCRVHAEQSDNLSLLSHMTPKAIRKYEKKGIFTVKQLSFLYKPRKRGKRAKKAPVTHKVELQALAIRTGKIYLQELPDLSRQPIELFLDIEGIPDQDMYYLIGLLVCEANSFTYHYFWADTSQEEAQIWQQFLEITNRYPDAPIYHYGDFEPRVITGLSQRYSTDSQSLKNRLINVNTYVYGKVYFPVRSNGLKDIGTFIGASWTAPNASGLQSLVWRHHWDETQDVNYQRLLVTYNEEDCRALRLLTDKLTKMKDSANTLSEIDFADRPKQLATEIGEEIHGEFKEMLQFAHSDYDKKKIRFRRGKTINDEAQEGLSVPKIRKSALPRKHRPRPTKTVRVPRRDTCPKCANQPLMESRNLTERFIIDLVFTKNGLRKTITRYWGPNGYCPQCYYNYRPPHFSVLRSPQSYGHGFKAWITYQRLFLRLPWRVLAQTVEDTFNEILSEGTIITYIRQISQYYMKAEESLINRIKESPFIHADETTMNIQGNGWYVWVFTDGKHAAFKLSETRESSIAHEFLAGYGGVLISDFYPGYDAIPCKQQKCWVHLIRDMNNDLWDAPFDGEYEAFVQEVSNLIIPIMETVQKYGLKKRHLGKFKERIDKFYAQIISDKHYKSELTLKYQNRFMRYRESLFTFVEYDGIPWHNNTAESAIRHLAVQRKISGSFKESFAPSYLILLGIMQTCRFQDKSFLRFLFSGEMDVDSFRDSKSRSLKPKNKFFDIEDTE